MAWPIPTSGEAMVSLKGRVGGGRYRRRRYYRRSQTSTAWVPYNFFDQDTLGNEAVALFDSTGAGNSMRPISLNPLDWLASENSGQTFQQMNDTYKVHRFQGSIPVYLHMYDGNDGDEVPTSASEYRVWYWWLREKAGGALDVVLPGNMDMLSPTGEGEIMMRRRDILAMGSFRLHRAGMDGRLWPTSASQFNSWNIHPEGHVARIPFPRLPKQGLRLARNEYLSLFTNCRYVNYQNGTGDPLSYMPLPNVGIGIDKIWAMPHFRYLVSQGR